jgi:uncharacterized membrane protein HdeD (DUF308 family)
MLQTLSKNWWLVTTRGVAAIIFGLLAVIWPDITLLALVFLFGAYSLVDGAFTLASAVFRRSLEGGNRVWLVLSGLAGIGIGIVTFIWPDITTLALLALIAAWAIVTGVLDVVAAVRLRREIEGEWLLAVSGVLSVVFGILLAIWPASGALALVILIGSFAIVFGAFLVALSLRLRKLRDAGTRDAVTLVDPEVK